MKIPPLLVVFLVVALQIPAVNAVEVSARKVIVQLSETITQQDKTAQFGLKEVYSAPEGKQFLSVAMDLVATGWDKDGPRSVECHKDAITLEIGEQSLRAFGSMRMENSYYFTGQDFRMSRPNSGDEDFAYSAPAFLVPADFKTGVLKIGDLVTVEVSSGEAVPAGSVLDGKAFTVTEASLVDDLRGRWNVRDNEGDLAIQPMKGKLLVTTIEISAAETLKTPYLSVLSRDFGVASEDGSLAPYGGTIRKARVGGSKEVISIGEGGGTTTTSVARGETGTMNIFFTVPDGQTKFSLVYRGEPVAAIQAD